MPVGPDDYDGTVALDMGPNDKPLKKITDDELKELKATKLMALFQQQQQGDGGGTTDAQEDIDEILDYSLAMVNSGRSMSYLVQELAQLGMEICPEGRAHEMAKLLAEYVQERNQGGGSGDASDSKEDGGDGSSNNRVVSLKVSKSHFIFFG